jgi:hypothetical protein
MPPTLECLVVLARDALKVKVLVVAADGKACRGWQSGRQAAPGSRSELSSRGETVVLTGTAAPGPRYGTAAAGPAKGASTGLLHLQSRLHALSKCIPPLAILAAWSHGVPQLSGCQTKHAPLKMHQHKQLINASTTAAAKASAVQQDWWVSHASARGLVMPTWRLGDAKGLGHLGLGGLQEGRVVVLLGDCTVNGATSGLRV